MHRGTPLGPQTVTSHTKGSGRDRPFDRRGSPHTIKQQNGHSFQIRFLTAHETIGRTCDFLYIERTSLVDSTCSKCNESLRIIDLYILQFLDLKGHSSNRGVKSYCLDSSAPDVRRRRPGFILRRAAEAGRRQGCQVRADTALVL